MLGGQEDNPPGRPCRVTDGETDIWLLGSDGLGKYLCLIRWAHGPGPAPGRTMAGEHLHLRLGVTSTWQWRHSAVYTVGWAQYV